ncbi:helix-turn-helix domain-containing protein [Rossellomorea sp. BNER]|uniref:helix-turn-helix domain-containing protein n=1 Tax=Rossellomorea sp. BNER TaxID=2962031 RepID=UPI003AF25FAB|nr:helix-turn-helix domain-containing protein [Rossellomorea sp. BNER]
MNTDKKEEKLNDKQKYMNEFGGRLRHLRKLRKKRIDAIAKHIGVHRSTYNSYELGYRLPSLQTLKSLAAFLETSTDYLLFKIDDYDAPGEAADIKEILESGPLVYGGEIISEEHRNYLASVVDSLIGNLNTLDVIIKNKSSK